MAVLDDDFAAELTLTESSEGICLSPAAPTCAPRDFRSLYEQERARADAAEARAEELRWAEVAARSDAGSWKSRFKACRSKLESAVEETKQLRRAVKAGAPGMHAEVARLRKLLSQAHAEPPVVASKVREQRIGALEHENRQLHKAVQTVEGHKETIRWQNREIVRLNAELRRLRDQKDKIRLLSEEAYRVRIALEVSEHAKEKLTARLAKLRALGATLSRLPFDEAAHLRNVLRRSRRQKTTIVRLRKENARLRKSVKAAKAAWAASQERLAKLRTVRKTLSTSLSAMDAELRRILRRSRRQKATITLLSRENARLRRTAKGARNRIEALEAELARLRSTGAVLSRRLYGRKSEQQKKPRSTRKRGHQRGAPGHGRTQRPGLDERPEVLAPPPDACVCAQCGQPYAPNGAEESTLVEIEVKAHKRVISRPRWRRTCACASSPMEVSAPPVPRLFRGTPYGITFWARFLFELCVCLRPVHRIAAWMSAQELAVSPGTLANSLKRFVPLFAPLFEAILAHQNEAVLRHADETGWRVQELRGEDRSNRAWLDAATAREEPAPGGRQPALPHPALGRGPQPWLAHPRNRAPPPARGLDRALQHHPRAHRDLRRDPALHRRRLPGLRMAPRRDHPRSGALRPRQALRQAPQGYLAPAPPTRLEAYTQSLKPHCHRCRRSARPIRRMTSSTARW